MVDTKTEEGRSNYGVYEQDNAQNMSQEKNLYYTYVEISRCKIVPISGFFFKNKNQLKLSLYTTCTGKKLQSTGTSVPVTLPSYQRLVQVPVVVTTTNFKQIPALVQTRTQKFEP